MKQLQKFSLVLSVLGCIFYPVHASFNQKKGAISIQVHDFSTQQSRKLIGSEKYALEMRILNLLNVFPIVIELKNEGEETFLLNSTSFSVPVLDQNLVRLRANNLPGKAVLALIGGVLSGYGSIASFILSLEAAGRASQSYWHGLQKVRGVQLGTISALACAYFMVTGFNYAYKVEKEVKKDQESWLDYWMLQPSGAILKPGTSIAKFIFLDKQTYQKGGFRMVLQAIHGEDLFFDVGILP